MGSIPVGDSEFSLSYARDKRRIRLLDDLFLSCFFIMASLTVQLFDSERRARISDPGHSPCQSKSYYVTYVEYHAQNYITR